MERLKQSLPALAIVALLIGVWWISVIVTKSMIFPTPWKVVTGTAEPDASQAFRKAWVRKGLNRSRWAASSAAAAPAGFAQASHAAAGTSASVRTMRTLRSEEAMPPSLGETGLR